MIYISIMLAGNVMTYKPVDIDGLTMLSGSLLTPFWFIVADIVTEVYGYTAYRRLIWIALFCSFLFSGICILLLLLPSPSSWMFQKDYDYIIDKLPRLVISTILGVTISSFINSYAISKWKILVKGKYFWLRSVAASSVGEMIFTFSTMLLVVGGTVTMRKMLTLMTLSFCLKIIMTTILAFPSVLIMRFLKKRESVDIYDYDTNFNPFKLT